MSKNKYLKNENVCYYGQQTKVDKFRLWPLMFLNNNCVLLATRDYVKSLLLSIETPNDIITFSNVDVNDIYGDRISHKKYFLIIEEKKNGFDFFKGKSGYIYIFPSKSFHPDYRIEDEFMNLVSEEEVDYIECIKIDDIYQELCNLENVLLVKFDEKLNACADFAIKKKKSNS